METQIIQSLIKKVDALEKKLDEMRTQRVNQAMIIPDSIKTRAMGEPNRYFLSGKDADRPEPNLVPGGTTYYFATDTNKLYAWNGTAWKSTTLL